MNVADFFLYAGLAILWSWGWHQTGKAAQRREDRIKAGTNDHLVRALRSKDDWWAPIDDNDRSLARVNWQAASSTERAQLQAKADQAVRELNNLFESDVLARNEKV